METIILIGITCLAFLFGMILGFIIDEEIERQLKQ